MRLGFVKWIKAARASLSQGPIHGSLPRDFRPGLDIGVGLLWEARNTTDNSTKHGADNQRFEQHVAGLENHNRGLEIYFAVERKHHNFMSCACLCRPWLISVYLGKLISRNAFVKLVMDCNNERSEFVRFTKRNLTLTSKRTSLELHGPPCSTARQFIQIGSRLQAHKQFLHERFGHFDVEVWFSGTSIYIQNSELSY